MNQSNDITANNQIDEISNEKIISIIRFRFSLNEKLKIYHDIIYDKSDDKTQFEQQTNFFSMSNDALKKLKTTN